MDIIKCSNCSKKYKDKDIIGNFDYVFKDKVYFLKGKNGSGKSTLLRLLSKVEKASSGYIDNSAENILFLTNVGLGHNFLTIKENIQLLYAIHNLQMNSGDKEFISNLYTGTQLNSLYETASLGMCLKVGCTLLSKFNHWDLILIDETLSGIDSESRKFLMNSLEKISSNSNACIIIVSHNNIETEYPTNDYITINLKGGH